MEFWLTASMSLLLLLCAVILILWHIHTWQRVQQQTLSEEDVDYYRRQYRRRMQSSAILGVLAVAIFLGDFITEQNDSKALFVGYWGSVVLLVVWMGLLALVDIVATRHHYSRIREMCLVEQAKLHAQIHSIRAGRRNGKASMGSFHPGRKEREPRDEDREGGSQRR